MAAHKNHQDRHYKHLREVVLWLHDYKCFVSGEFHPNLEVHHINKISTDNSILNLIPVTPAIHLYLGKATKLNPLTKEHIRNLIKAKLEKYYI